MKRITVAILLTVGLLVLGGTQVPSAQTALTISNIQINQALGVQLSNHLNFVAGKDTIIRALLPQQVTVDPSTTRAVITRDRDQVVVLAPRSYSGPTDVVDFPCPSRAACGNWAAGSYLFSVTVNGVSKDTTGTPYLFVERRAVRVLAMPVKANYAGEITQVPNDKWKTMWRFTQHVYPLAADKIGWTIGEEFDGSAAKYDLETNAGQLELWQALTNLMPAECKINRSAAGCYDLIVGFISDRPNTYPRGKLQGYTYGKPTNLVVAKDEDAEATVAHEIGHVYGIGDTYSGGSIRCSANPAPNGTLGGNWDDPARTSGFGCTDGRVRGPGDVDATMIPKAQYPYEVGGRDALADVACFMGSGGKQAEYWITQDAYDWLFTQLAPLPASDRASDARQRVIEFSGVIWRNGEVESDPWMTATTASVDPDSTGAYQIQAVDGSGTVLATQALDIAYRVHSNPPRDVDPAPFEGTMRFPTGTTKFQILKNSTVLKEIAVSANAPTVSNVSPAAATTIGGEYLLTWNASDADHDPLTFTVEYNPDVSRQDSMWVVLASDLTTTAWTENFSGQPGGLHGQIRVTASDGVLSATVYSAEFVVPVKAPSVVIDDPADGYSYSFGDTVELSAEAEDVQDGIVADAGLIWTSNLLPNTILSTGGVVALENLPAGQHVITVTATNSRGVSASHQITITVARDTPIVTWANPASIVAGTGLSATQLNATANVPGTFVYTPASGTVLSVGANQALSVTFTPTDTTNYATATATVSVTVTPFVGPRNGGGWSGTISGSTLIYHGGAYAIVNGRVNFPDCTTFIVGPNGSLNGGAATPNCTAGGSALVTPTITWATPSAVAVGTVLSSVQLNASASAGGSEVAGTFVYAPALGTPMTTVGNQTLSVVFTPTATATYTPAAASVTVAVTSSGNSFIGPRNGGGWSGTISGGNLLYRGGTYPIVNGRVNFPDCTTFITGPNGSLNGGAATPDCTPGGGSGGSSFVGPRNGGGWSGTISGSNLIYNSLTYPIVNGRVNFPDCTTYIVGPNGALIGGSDKPN